MHAFIFKSLGAIERILLLRIINLLKTNKLQRWKCFKKNSIISIWIAFDLLIEHNETLFQTKNLWQQFWIDRLPLVLVSTPKSLTWKTSNADKICSPRVGFCPRLLQVPDRHLKIENQQTQYFCLDIIAQKIEHYLKKTNFNGLEFVTLSEE